HNNMLLGSVNLIKEDSETSEKLEGAEFKLYSKDNKELGTYTTDKNGVLEVKDLRPGEYYFVETKAPIGYELDNSKYGFKITLDETESPIELIVQNTKVKEDDPNVENPKQNDEPKDNSNKPNINGKTDKPKDKETIIDNIKKNILPKTGYEVKYLYLCIALIAVGIILVIVSRKKNNK
ncbi:SpaA isopeptide-forming pilin-related protein, partial [Clostridium baratii]